MSLHLPPRAWVEASIESLIAMLDHIDGDGDLEDDHDGREPEEGS